MVNACGVTWHLECFGCWDCGKKFYSDQCIAIDNKPYCDRCGRKAFVKAMMSGKNAK